MQNYLKAKLRNRFWNRRCCWRSLRRTWLVKTLKKDAKLLGSLSAPTSSELMQNIWGRFCRTFSFHNENGWTYLLVHHFLQSLRPEILENEIPPPQTQDEVGHLGPPPTDWGLSLSLVIVPHKMPGTEQAPCKYVEGMDPPCQLLLHNVSKNEFIKIWDVFDFSYF